MLTEKLRRLIVNGFDFVTLSLISIPSDHSNIHNGYGGIAGEYLELTAGEVVTYCFTTPEDNYVHFKNTAINTLGSSIKLEILTGADVTLNTGTELIISNPNDVSSTIPSSTIKKNPSFTGGERLDFVVALADSTNQSVGSGGISTAVNEELVFEPNSQYIIRITELNGNTANIFWRSFWYEEPRG